ncbi:hypothetical protein GLOTRDRAFT_134567 [Gloeophyllum trabeum ATCC 11539]|uniref:Uncharacterized protein n=1 Tax=Gloeophyllum trabeum (strain ATCC 11539 / FP-39264 / Madison 617) TaxID=670483 RepID=S7R618_GLOTA|nr:uncharacterized protein GLOTRDRAFT_134567 [Gloeophyllum trabeum ATCC 11539]EPQ49825.1 hypothetical protein GLOTRDRAFT_134567 [Gloeophyllum trabeum ATCC 11539]
MSNTLRNVSFEWLKNVVETSVEISPLEEYPRIHVSAAEQMQEFVDIEDDVLIPAAFTANQPIPCNDYACLEAAPLNYVITPLPGQQCLIPRRTCVTITGLGYVCWFDRIIDIDVLEPDSVIMEGWVWRGYFGHGWILFRFHAKVHSYCLELPTPWISIVNLSTRRFSELYLQYDLFNLYRLFQYRILEQGLYQDEEDMNHDAELNNWLGEMREAIYLPITFEEAKERLEEIAIELARRRMFLV